MIKKMMNACKIGAPKVDLVLEDTEAKPGGKISGSIYVQGGWLKQKTTRLECDLVEQIPGGKTKFVAPAKTILMSQEVDINEKKELPFHYRIPNELNPSSEKVSYQLRTKLVFKDNSKCTDQDEITVRN